MTLRWIRRSPVRRIGRIMPMVRTVSWCMGSGALLLGVAGCATRGALVGTLRPLREKVDVELSEPPLLTASALLDDDALVVADLHGGHIELFDRMRGARLREVGEVGTRRGEFTTPVRVFKTAGGYGVWDAGRRVVLRFDRRWTFIDEERTYLSSDVPQPRRWDPSKAVLALPGREVVLGYAAAALFSPPAPGNAYLFSLAADGSRVPLAWFTAEGEAGLRQRLAVSYGGGALLALPDSGWIALVGGTFEFLRFDGGDRLVARWPGSREVFAPPDIDSLPNAATNEALTSWWNAQIQVGGLVEVRPGRIGVLLVRPGRGGQAREAVFEVYDLASHGLVSRYSVPAAIGRESKVVFPSGGRGVASILVQDQGEGLETKARYCEYAVPQR